MKQSHADETAVNSRNAVCTRFTSRNGQCPIQCSYTFGHSYTCAIKSVVRPPAVCRLRYPRRLHRTVPTFITVSRADKDVMPRRNEPFQCYRKRLFSSAYGPNHCVKYEHNLKWSEMKHIGREMPLNLSE